MDKRQQEAVSRLAEVNTGRKTDEYLKPNQGKKNLLNFILGRQLGKQKNDADMAKWLWTLTRSTPGWRWPLPNHHITYMLMPTPNHSKRFQKSGK
ncbi:rCG44244 [Rattus norvegicus]|uniref:RCG44244 n=2 Tax=Rattus norvegicus TaxID=10116 RepID=A6KUQ6_RAT|nr:rCG44244 [Rattus norvegicus]